MSSTVIKEFLVSLGLETEGAAGFDAAVGKATLAVAGLGAVVFAAVGGMFAFTKAIADQYDELGDLSNRIDVSVASIEEFGYIAQLTGSDIATANSSLEQFSKTAGDAANKMGRGQKVFEQLGITVTGANGKVRGTVELLGEVGDKIKDMERGQQTAILGRLGLDRTLVDALTTDVSGLRDEFKKLYDATGLDANTAAEKAGKFMDALDRLDFVISTVGKSLAVNFMDRFTDALDSLRKLIVDNLPAIMRAITPVIKIILALADVFIAVVYRIAQGAGKIIGWVSDVVESMNGWVVAIGLVALAWKRFNLAFLATPVGMVLAMGVALGLLIDDFMVWKEGGDSLIDWSQWQTEIDFVTAGLAQLSAALEAWFGVLFHIMDAVVKLFKGDFSGAVDSAKLALQAFGDFIYSLFGPVLDFVSEQFKSAFGYITSIIDAVIGKASAAVGWVKDAASSVGGFLGISDSEEGAPKDINTPPASAPSAAEAAKSGGAQTITQETNIHVNGAGNPEAVGKSVAGQQGQVNGDMARNMKGAVR